MANRSRLQCRQLMPTLVLVAAIIHSSLATLDTSTIVNKKIERSIDLSSQLIKLTERVMFENAGTSPVTSYFVALSQKQADRLAYIEASVNNVPLKINSDQGPALGANGLVMNLYEVELGSKSLAVGESNKQALVLTLVFTRLLRPYPEQITQSERQFVKYEGYQTVVTPYLTKTQTTKIKLPEGARLESFSKAVKQSTGTGRLTYGPFNDVESTLTSKTKPELMNIHYENNQPFVAITRLERSLEVSHWAAKVSVDNKIDVAHVGAKLKGPFSRYEYQRDHNNGISSVRNFLTRLPLTAQNIYYRDAIGNISTSDVRKSQTATLVNVRPRFPLFGGWVTNYMLGYSLPAGEFLTVDGNNYKLSLTVADLFYDNMVVDEATLRIVLPEGTHDIIVEAPFEIERLPDEILYSYLDTMGRPVIVLRKQNIVDQHVSKSIIVSYKFDKIYLLQEPLLLIGALFLIFLLAAIFSRMSFSMGSKSTKTVSRAHVHSWKH